jgi:Ca2+-binding EF-hand superfamily protein
VLSDGSLDGFDGVQGDLKNEITQMIQEYDKNNDGVIDFDEFMAMMQESSKNTRNSIAKTSAVKC